MAIERSSGTSNVIDVLDRVLDKGIVIDAWVLVSLAGIDLLTVEARVVVASIATYLDYAGAVAEHLPVSAPPAVSHPVPEGDGGWSQTVEDLLRRFHAQMDERGLNQHERRRAEDRIFEELRDARARVVQPGKTGRRPAASRAGSKRRKHSGPR